MTTPIFVLGKHRSGTTWLGNQLCEHPLIAGVTHEHHDGIHESAYFSRVYGRYGDLRLKQNFVEFVEATHKSDLFRLIGADRATLYALWPTSYEAVLHTLMDRYAQKKGARYWLDKTPEHTLMVEEIAALYPDAKFIAIIRDVEDVLASTVGRYGSEKMQHKKRLLFLTTLSWLHSNKTIKRFAVTSDRIFLTRYETLKNEPERVFQEMCEFLDLPFDSAMLEQAYRPNTTFRAGVKRSSVLSKQDKTLVRTTARLGDFIPKTAMDAVRRVYALGGGRKPLPAWFYSMYPPFEELTQLENGSGPSSKGSAVDL